MMDAGGVLGIVGIGASAGGLEALQKVISSLQAHSAFCYVVAQHLSPTHTSMLRELLARGTPLTVRELTDGETPTLGTILITPPNADVELREGRLRLLQPEHPIGPKPSVDRLFFSLAKDAGSSAVGIILSGTGGDGAKGLAAIKKAGGLTIVQEPRSAKYSGMPNAALHWATVDYIVPAEEIGGVLDSHLKGESYLVERDDEEQFGEDLRGIVQIVLEHAGIDLSGYKLSTLNRRLQRRISNLRLSGVAAYAAYLRENFEEASILAREVLISVTGFFRDSEAFTTLGRVIGEMFEQSLGEGGEIRVWNPGCATGEETYSLAIMLEEVMREQKRHLRYKIFATDIDARAIFTARQGVYSASSASGLSPELLESYFEVQGDEIVAKKSLRNTIVFSVHNLVQDPPFSRIDLISCRNVLIYFNNAMQKRLLGIFSYSLAPTGLLFLGKSEFIELYKELFVPVNKEARIFRKQSHYPFVRHSVLEVDRTARHLEAAGPRRRLPEQSVSSRISQLVADVYGPPGLAINGLDEVVYILGDVTPYVGMRSGPTGLSVFTLINEKLRTELRALIFKCRREGAPAFGVRRSLNAVDGPLSFRLAVRPLGFDGSRELPNGLLIAFELQSGGREKRRKSDSAELDATTHTRVLELEQELAGAQEHLRTVIEELETSNEELQSMTEELQSSNEELQATNEELQTANEELQSTNEELLTVNDELEVKSHELENALADLQNILYSTEYPLIVVDANLRVTRFVPAVGQILDKDSIHSGDIITALPWRVELKDLRGILKHVMGSKEPYANTVRCGDRYYRFIVKPYRRDDGQVLGAVLWFPEVTDLTLANMHIQAGESHLRAILESMLVGVITIDVRGTIQGFNRTAERMFGYTSGEIIGQRVEVLMPKEYALPHQQYIDHYLKTGHQGVIGNIRELEAVRKGGGRFPIELSVSEMEVNGHKVFCGVVVDITRRKEAERRLQEEQTRALVTLESINDAVISVDSQLRVQYMNPTAEELTGWSNGAAVGMALTEVFQVFDEKSRLSFDTRIQSEVRIGGQVRLQDGIILKRADGSELCIEYSQAPLLAEQGEVTGAVLSFHDVTNKRMLLQQMTWQAQHDPLTGLVNRNEFERRVEYALASAKSFGRQHALLYMDLDQFKVVNDTSGHHAGDELLRQLAGILAAALRHRDTLARMGGDEFAVLLENCSLSQAEQIADKLHELVQEFRFTHDDKLFKIGVSIGVVPIIDSSETLAALLSNADAACYAAKESGRNRVVTHSVNDKEFEFKRSEMHWVARIEQAIDENRFKLYFQPIRSLKELECQRWEVLLRLEDSEGSLVLPGAFIPAAERFGHVQRLDRWVLTRIVGELAKHSSHGKPIVSINLSGGSIVNPKFCEYAVSLVKKNIDIAEQLCFEVTETTAIANFAMAQEFMRSMKRLGCLFALDDFGSGMSSFGYLKNLPVDYLKIDGVFVKDILHDPIDLFMVESINRIGQIMNIKTIAEFVESEAVTDKLVQIGVDYAQGFALGKPISLEDFLSQARS